ncbi:MAG TPA: GNAT family N-acetyltransferase [Roseiflexaceae bacterium]|nr:GNAT family N-acetyltransferase [Roseiflexaceae bacterium]
MNNLSDCDIILHTDRLVLRTVDHTFAARCLDYVARNREFFEAWNPVVDETFYTLAFQEGRLKLDYELRSQDRAVRLWLFKRDDRAFERVVGDLAFSNIVRGAFQSCHLGYKIDGAESSRGLMTEALARASRFAFEQLKLHRIEANIMPRNARSRRVIEKLGFVNEGLSRKYLKIAGVWEDHLHYVMLNPDEEM